MVRAVLSGPLREGSARLWSIGDVLVPTAVVGLLFAGYFKATPAMAWLPVDLTFLLALATALAILGTALAKGADLRLPLGAVAMALTFIPGVLLASDNAYSTDKVLKLALTATAALAPIYLLTTARRQAAYVSLHVVAGVLVAVGELMSPAEASETIRLALEGTGTIASARAIGVAIVVLLVVAMTQGRHRMLLCTGAGVLSYFLIGSGSRGPLLAVGIAVLVVALIAPGRWREARYFLIGGGIIALWWLISSSGLEGAARIRDTINGQEFNDEQRFVIWEYALAAIRENPQGVGWGNFWTVLPPGARHNPNYIQYAHNALLEAAVEGGWIAGAAIVAFIVASLWRLSQGRGARQYALLSIAVFFTVNAFVSGDVNDNRTAWAALAMAWVCGPVGAPRSRRTGVVGGPRQSSEGEREGSTLRSSSHQ